MNKRRSTAIQDAKPMARVNQESKNWATAGRNLEGMNTRGMVMQEVPARTVFNTRGDRFYTESEPMMTQSRAIPNRGKTKGMVKGASCPECGGKMSKGGMCKCGGMSKRDFESNAKHHAKIWNANAESMSQAKKNPQTHFVFTQTPKGEVTGRHSLPPKPSKMRGSAMTKKLPLPPNRRARQHAQAWADSAESMSQANAKSPMVIEQSPKGTIMGRHTSAKPVGSKASAARKMSKSALPMPGGQFPGGRYPDGSTRPPRPMPKPMPRPRPPMPRVPGRMGMGLPGSMGMGKAQGAYIDGAKAPQSHATKMSKAARPRPGEPGGPVGFEPWLQGKNPGFPGRGIPKTPTPKPIKRPNDKFSGPIAGGIPEPRPPRGGGAKPRPPIGGSRPGTGSQYGPDTGIIGPIKTPKPMKEPTYKEKPVYGRGGQQVGTTRRGR